MNADQLFTLDAQTIVPTYARFPVAFTHGRGAYLFDDQGRRYLDFAAGIAVAAMGHAWGPWIEAIQRQAAALAHVSNLFFSEPMVQLARRLTQHSFADKVFFCNSGSEANETALKFARKWARARFGPQKHRVLAFEDGFHGRSLGALSLTHKPKYRQPFEPLVPGVTFAPFNDLAAAERVIDDDTCAVFVEPVQGEGGVHPARPEFLAGLRELCQRHNALLVFDEVQCGLGRTGHLWAHQAAGVIPDIMTLAKPLAGGLPIGATLVTEAVASILEPGDHGSTFGGNPIACAAALPIFDRISQPEFLRRVAAMGQRLVQGLEALASRHIAQVRGAGLMIGVELDQPVKPLLEAALARGLVVINAGENVLRLTPPLIVSPAEIDQALVVLGACLGSLAGEG
jgi:predicted acetylornithine/succinylornithine family transaminase